MEKHFLRRSTSEPPPFLTTHRSTSPISVSSVSRRRVRPTILSYEQGKDCVGMWLNMWDSEQIRSVLEVLVKHCNVIQLGFLKTALESVPHHDFLYHAKRKFPSFQFSPLSTPISRQLKEKLHQSRRPENKRLYRTESTLINSEISMSMSLHMILPTTPHETTPVEKLPGIRPSTAPEQITLEKPQYSVRLCSPGRRHMQITLSHLGTPHCYTRSTTTRRSRLPYLQDPYFSSSSSYLQLPEGALTFLNWFSSLDKDWQQQDILQLVVWSLDVRELYCLVTLLLSRQYRDFISDLPESIVIMILSYVPGKDLLQACRVCRSWRDRCSNDSLWRIKCSQIPLGVPAIVTVSWKQLFIDDIKLKRNWRLGQAKITTLTAHTHRVLCVRVKEDEGICASGGADRTIRIWSMKDGRLMNTIYGHVKNIWCLTFYGLNLLVSGSGDCSIRIWNFRNGTCERSLEGHSGTVWSVQQKGDLMISGSHDNTAIIWNIRQCQYLCHLRGHTGAVFAVDLNDTTTTAFTASGDKSVRIWNINDSQCIRTLSISDQHPVVSLHYSKGLLVCSAGSIISLWSVNNGIKTLQLKGHQDRVESVHLVTSGSNANTVISCSKDHLIKYWNINSGRCIRTLENHKATVNDIHRDTMRLVSVSDDCTLKIWDFHPNTKCASPKKTAKSKYRSNTAITRVYDTSRGRQE